MDQKKVLPVFGFLFWLLSYSASFSATIVSPQEFTDEVYSCCLNNDFDRFLGWLQTTELLPMNRSFKETTDVTMPATLSELDTVYYRGCSFYVTVNSTYINRGNNYIICRFEITTPHNFS